tara:strand:+ start:2754 stop:3344 length:591 start_codon:yes stop_codon:yes gene_type:complete
MKYLIILLLKLMNRINGLYGGFFNPFHKGHLHVIKTSVNSLGLQELLVIPTYNNPLKSSINSQPIEDQISSLQSKINLPKVKVSDFEYKYKIESTFELLQKIDSFHSIKSSYLIIGLDQLGQLHLWKNYKWIIQNISICVIYRPRYDNFIDNSQVQRENPSLFMPDLNSFINNSAPCMYIIKDTGVDISSSEIRDS